MALISAACSKEKVTPLTKVRVHVSDFVVSQEPIGAKDGTSVADCERLKGLTLAFYNGATEAYKVTQQKGSLAEGETFGEFSLSLPMGNYTMVVLGYDVKEGDAAPTLSSPEAASFGDGPVRETFVTTQSVNITNANAVDISAVLNRVVAKLRVVSSDVRTADASKIRITVAAGGKSFSPTTGLATVNEGFSHTVNTSTAVGVASASAVHLFLAADEQTMNVTVETLDADDNVLFTKVVENVPFKRNRATVLTGAVYTNSSISGLFLVNTDWMSDYNINF